MALTDKLYAIGEAIRSKTGGIYFLTLDEMPAAIRGIIGGDLDYLVEGSITKYSNYQIGAIRSYAFINCYALTSVDCINVTILGNYAFSNCDALNDIKLPAVREVGEYAFSYCNGMTTLQLPSAITVSSNAFLGCDNLESVYMPLATTIESYAFSSCKNLTKLDLPSATSIGNSALINCTKLTALILRNSEVCELGGIIMSNPIASGNGYIYVPSNLVDQYKSAAGWSTHASKIRAIEDYPDICA